MELYFSVENQKIIRIDNNFVVAGSKNYLFANFTFTDDWTGNITAIFSSKSGTYAQPIKDGRYPVPYEVIQKDGRLNVSVCAGDLITSNTVSIIIHETGYTEEAKASITPPPTILSEIYARIETGLEQAKNDVLDEIKQMLVHDGYIKSTDVDLELTMNSKRPIASGTVYNRLQSEIDRRFALEAKKADKEYNSGFIGGKGALLVGVGGAAVGGNTKTSSGMAGGYGAVASEGMAGGKGAYASHGAAVGRNSKTLHGAALGDGAKTIDIKGNPITAVQIGAGINQNKNTVQFFNYRILNSDGSIPSERIPALSELEQRVSELEERSSS